VATGDKLQQRLVKRIREIAKRRGIMVSHLPDRADVSRSHFWAVLALKTSPTLNWIGAIAEALEVDPSDLLAR
jgi:transcriptional regulator with XRE-family HTH domain